LICFALFLPSQIEEDTDREDGKRHNTSHHTYTQSTTESDQPIIKTRNKSNSPPTIAPVLLLRTAPPLALPLLVGLEVPEVLEGLRVLDLELVEIVLAG